MSTADTVELGEVRPEAQLLAPDAGARHARESPLVRALTIAVCALLMVAIGAYSLTTPNVRAAHPGTTASLVPAKSKLVLVSIDGFRHDYIHRRNRTTHEYIAPNLRALARAGVSSAMQPVMPTKTFPNHNSIATGLFPAWSGIVGNTMYNPKTKKWFHLSEKDPSWWKGDPIWKTLRTAGRTTAAVMWPGSDIAGRTPNAFWTYSASITYKQRVDRAVSLLSGAADDLPANKTADFLTLYFEGVDHAGHANGPNSVQVDNEIARVDRAIGDLLRRTSDLSLVVVSDHGMAEIDKSRIVDLDPAVPKGVAMSVTITPVLFLINETLAANKLYSTLRKRIASTGHGQIFKKEELPDRWHLRSSILVPEVVGLTDLGWMFNLNNAAPDVESHPNMSVSSRKIMNLPNRGNHGFDNIERDMQALFIASGPAFRAGASVHNMRAVDIYPLICTVYGVKPSPNNGSLATVRHLVRSTF